MPFNNTIPLRKTKYLYVDFQYSFLNGIQKFFDQYKKVYIQLRISDETGGMKSSLILNEYNINLQNKNLYKENELIEFIFNNEKFIIPFESHKIDISKKYFVYICIKTAEECYRGDSWNIQSIAPLQIEK